jgi:hypothetical protein
MAEREKVTALGRLLGATAEAHHTATGGVNPDWARWYGEHLAGQIDEFVGFSPDVELITEWLTWADEKHRTEAPDERWPFYYAALILDRVGQDG